MAATKDAILGILANEQTRTFLGKIANGDDPRRAAAELAGGVLTARLAQALGAMPAPRVVNDTPRATDSNVIDADFVTINVTEEAKKAGGKK